MDAFIGSKRIKGLVMAEILSIREISDENSMSMCFCLLFFFLEFFIENVTSWWIINKRIGCQPVGSTCDIQLSGAQPMKGLLVLFSLLLYFLLFLYFPINFLCVLIFLSRWQHSYYRWNKSNRSILCRW